MESTLGLLLGELGTGGNLSSLFSLSLFLLGLLLFLVSLDSFSLVGLLLFWLQGSSFLDQFDGSTDNGSLVLDGLSGSLLGGFLSDTLLVVSSEQNGPSNSSWVLSLVE